MGLRFGRRALLAWACALAGCAGDGLAPGEIDAAAAAEMARRPEDYVNGEARAFQVSRGGRVAGVLWGTYHVGYDETTVLPRAMRDRFAAASSLSVEVVLDRVPVPTRRAVTAVRNGALLRADPAALERLDPETRRALDAVGLPGDVVRKLSLLGLAQAVNARATATPAGALPVVGFVDANLIGFARNMAIPVRGLDEADAAQVERLVYAEPNGEAGLGALRLALRRQTGAAAFVAWIRRRYATGEIGVLRAGMVGWRADAGDLARSDRGRAGLFAERNAAWMPRLEAALEEPGAAFVAFGAGHLLGTDGVVALLQARGWEVSGCVRDRCVA